MRLVSLPSPPGRLLSIFPSLKAVMAITKTAVWANETVCPSRRQAEVKRNKPHHILIDTAADAIATLLMWLRRAVRAVHKDAQSAVDGAPTRWRKTADRGLVTSTSLGAG